MPTVTGDINQIAGTAVTSGEVRFTATKPVVQDPTAKTTALATSVAEHTVPLTGTGIISTTLPATGDDWVYRVEISAHVGANKVQGLPRLLLEVPAAGADLSDAGVEGSPSGRVVVNRLVGRTELTAAVAPIQQTADNALTTAQSAEATADNAVGRVEELEILGGVAPGDPTDATIALHMQQPTSQTQAALNAQSAQVLKAEGPAVQTDTVFSTLQAVIDATPARTIVEVRRPWTITEPLVIDRPMTLRTAGEGEIITATSIDAIRVQADNVTISARITGLGGDASSSQTAQRAISCEGTSTAHRSNLTVSGSIISGFNRSGVELAFVDGFTIMGCTMDTIAYAGVLAFSVQGGLILGNRISNITQAGSYPNSYGVAITRRIAQSVADSPNSRDVIVMGNIIDGVPLWEGIDTHGGVNITVTGNQVYDCRDGIAMVVAVSPSGPSSAPQNSVVTGNTVAWHGAAGGARNGIVLSGDDSATATGGIDGNTVTGYGVDRSEYDGAIKIQNTRGATVTANKVDTPAYYGIMAQVRNAGFTITGNTITDVWSESARCAAVTVGPGGDNTGIVSGNTLTRATATKPTVNRYGIYIPSGLTNVEVECHGNDFSVATTPVQDSARTKFTVNATRRNFGGGTPTQIQPVNGNASTPEETRILANQIRLRLIELGILT